MKRTLYNKFNRGEVSPEALARDDVKMVAESASHIKNFLPKRLGTMMRRPGTQYIASLPGAAYFLPFTRAIDDQALLEFTNNQIRVWVDDAVLTRRNVQAGSQLPALSSWSLYGAGATYSGGVISVYGDGGTRNDAFDSISLDVLDRNVEIGLRIVITQAPLEVRIGTTNAVLAEDLFRGWLDPGTYSFAVTSSNYIAVTVSSDKPYVGKLTSCQIEDNVDLTLPTTITTAMLPSVRMAQANDVVFIAADSGGTNSHAMFRIMRYGEKSWGVANVRSDDGPFREINTGTITMTPTASTGDTTLTASAAYFNANMVGSLFKINSKGQNTSETFTAISQYSESIEVIGSGAGRVFSFNFVVTGLWGTTGITLQQSIDDNTWSDITTYAGGATINYYDGYDNQIIYYRFYSSSFDVVNTTSVLATVTYPGGSKTGVCRVTGYTSTTSVSIQVLETLGGTIASDNWYEGAWSAHRGFPTAVSMHEGRLWFAGASNIWGSVSDVYSSFDRDVVGDSASIYRSIAFESSANIYWLASTERLVAGMTADEASVRSSSFNEILTPNNAVIRAGTGNGAAPADKVAMGGSIYFVQRGLRKIIALSYDANTDSYDVADLMKMHPDLCYDSSTDGIKRIAVTRMPDTRIWAVMNNGEVRVLLVDPMEEVSGWSRLVIGESAASGTDTITDVVTIPGLGEDRVYFVVKRGSTYYLEKLAKLEEAIGATTSYHTDAAIWVAGPTTTPACAHITNGSTVRVWSADNAGKDLGEFTVAAGAITLPAESTLGVVIGIAFNADYTSNKIAGFADYTVQSEWIRMVDVGLIARHIVPSGITHGPSFSELEALPAIESGTTYIDIYKQEDYDVPPMEFNGTKSVKDKFYLRAKTPITIMGLTYGIYEAKNKNG